ncbi:MAG: hypothetical protein AAB385_08135, partial [Planctomycetota bacterium]
MQRLRGRGHVRLAGEYLPPFFRRLDDQRAIAVVPIGRLLILRVRVRVYIFAVRLLIEIRLERILCDPHHKH